MSERQLFGVAVRVIGLQSLIRSLEWVFGPHHRLLEVPSTTRTRVVATFTWANDLVAASWKVGVGFALLRWAPLVVRLAYP